VLGCEAGSHIHCMNEVDKAPRNEKDQREDECRRRTMRQIILSYDPFFQSVQRKMVSLGYRENKIKALCPPTLVLKYASTSVLAMPRLPPVRQARGTIGTLSLTTTSRFGPSMATTLSGLFVRSLIP